VYDVKCTHQLAPFITNAGGQPLMWKSGHSILKDKMRKTGACLGGELSGHLFFKDRGYGFDDGLYAAARLLEILSTDQRPPVEVFAALPMAISTPELRVAIDEQEVVAVMAALGEQLRVTADAKVMLIDGIRLDFSDGWGLVRASNTLPCLTFRFEASSGEALERVQAIFRHAMLDIKPEWALPF
ncbi:MAG: phosphomannomutase / phosphoglucomutase, partial [Halothiobacillaceae bacterium]